jgi:formylglycine-generating enzyme required for sulfatase activity
MEWKQAKFTNMYVPFSFKHLLTSIAVYSIGTVLALTGRPAMALDCPSYKYKPSSQTPIVKDMVNPSPSENDFELPMPCGGKLILRHLCFTVKSFLDDFQLKLGCEDCRGQEEGFMEAKHVAKLAGAFTREDLPELWRVKLIEIAKRGDGRCLASNGENSNILYYFIGKYEITNWQYQTVMKDDCPGWDKPFTTEDPRPKTNISWFEAIEFTRRYTEWLLKNKPDSIPLFPDGRYAYIRLPTEAEWEYAARGGHMVAVDEMNQNEFFPLKSRPLSDYALYTRAGAAKPPEKIAWIGTKCPNPLGLYDTAGNAAEMMLDPFRFSIGSRLHGATGGFVAKGGSYRKSRAEIMPGRREEMPFFLEDGAFRSTELGLRVVLSGIVTPQNRSKKLRQAWAEISGENRRFRSLAEPSQSKLDLDQSKSVIAEIERLAAATDDKAEKQKYLSISEYLKHFNYVFAKKEAEEIDALIWEALFLSESIVQYSTQHRLVQQNLEMLKNLKTQRIPEAEIESVDRNISTLTDKIHNIDAVIDYLVKSYIGGIQKSQEFSDDAIERQLNLIILNRKLEQNLRMSLNGKLNLFRDHISLFKKMPESVQKNDIVKDIVSAYQFPIR